jgi:hypothetical protein
MIRLEFTRARFNYKDKKVNGMLTAFCLTFFGQFSVKLLFFGKED